MRIFQNGGIHNSYIQRLNQLSAKDNSFGARRRQLLNDRFGAMHFLKPVLDGDSEAFFTNGDDRILQQAWAREHNMRHTNLADILLAQIEDHRTEIFYNTDPTRYDSSFLRRLPGCVKKTVCWRAAPSGGADLTAYGMVICNFPSILENWRLKGCKVGYFYPAVDPVMDEYGEAERTIDILFVGTYSRHHLARVEVLQSIAALSRDWNVVYYLDTSRMTRLAESIPGMLFPQLRRLRRPKAIKEITRAPVFGRDLYRLLGSAKMVLNGAIDMAGQDRGNMRCFETMGCGALLLSDDGIYPEGMKDGETMFTYKSPDQAVNLVRQILSNKADANAVAVRGRKMIAELYNKTLQWQRFVEIVSLI
jgi:glycosyl transferase family 1